MKAMEKAGAVMRFFGWSVFVALSGAPLSQAQAAECLTYDSPVTLEGTLVLETFAGPPNYEDVRKGDEPETVLLLQLKQPICMDAAADGMSDAAQGVAKIQLALRAGRQFAGMKTLVGRNVRLSGSLFGAISGHHHTPVLLQNVMHVSSR